MVCSSVGGTVSRVIVAGAGCCRLICARYFRIIGGGDCNGGGGRVDLCDCGGGSSFAPIVVITVTVTARRFVPWLALLWDQIGSELSKVGDNIGSMSFSGGSCGIMSRCCTVQRWQPRPLQTSINGVDMNSNPIISKIAKVLALASDQAGTPEGETAAKLASRMMTAHAVTMSQIDAATALEVDPLETQQSDHPMSVWRRSLANACAVHCGARSAYRSGYGSGLVITWYGFRSDIEVARYLFEICERQIDAAARLHVASLLSDWAIRCQAARDNAGPDWIEDYDLPARPPVRKIGNAFRRSAVTALWYRLQDIRAGERGNQSTNETAIVSARSAHVSEFMRQFKLGRGSAGRYAHNRAGAACGKSLSLSAGLGGSGSAPRGLLG